MTLSDKEIENGGIPLYFAQDVREFIKELKKEIKHELEDGEEIFRIISELDKLAGDKLI